MSEAILVAALALFLANPVTVTRVRAWVRRRRRARRDFCETCGAVPRRIHVVSAQLDDETEGDLGGTGAGSLLTATYCRRHAPSIARRRANPRG